MSEIHASRPNRIVQAHMWANVTVIPARSIFVFKKNCGDKFPFCGPTSPLCFGLRLTLPVV